MSRDLAKTAFNLILFFVILFVFTKLFGPIPFSVDSITTTKSTTFDVTAEGTAEVKPDISNVQAGVSANGSTSEAVRNRINDSISKISQAVKDEGVDSKDIQTANYNINPNYDFNQGQRITGYSANTTLTIKVRDVEKVDSVIDAAVSAGANNVNSLGFEVEDRAKYENEARKEAVEKAKKKAEDAAKIAGFKLGKIINYSENFAGVPVPLTLEAQGRGGDLGSSIEPGTDEIKVIVTLSYEIK
jgi:uncharacterized protein